MKTKTVTQIVTTEAQLAKAFTEWDRRYREEPECYENEAQHLLKDTPKSYGQACAPYLVSILIEQEQAAFRDSVTIVLNWFERLFAKDKSDLTIGKDQYLAATKPKPAEWFKDAPPAWGHFCHAVAGKNVIVPVGNACPRCGATQSSVEKASKLIGKPEEL